MYCKSIFTFVLFASIIDLMAMEKEPLRQFVEDTINGMTKDKRICFSGEERKSFLQYLFGPEVKGTFNSLTNFKETHGQNSNSLDTQAIRTLLQWELYTLYSRYQRNASMQYNSNHNTQARPGRTDALPSALAAALMVQPPNTASDRSEESAAGPLELPAPGTQ